MNKVAVQELRREAMDRYEQGQLEDALARYEQLCQLEPNDPDVLCDMGTVCFTMGRVPECIACYRKALEISLSHKGTLANLKGACHEAGLFWKDCLQAISRGGSVLDTCEFGSEAAGGESAPHRSADVDELIMLVRPYTLLDSMRLAVLHGLCQEALLVEGEVVECGVCNGGSAAMLAAILRDCPDSTLWLYDVFDDAPPAEAFSSATAGYSSSVDTVLQVLRRVDFPLDRAVIRKGMFEETFRQPLPAEIRLLHIDAECYDSVLDALCTFYPLVSEGGIIILDDFGHWEGAREAFYDFCAQQNIRPLLERVGYTQAFWRKDHEHNRFIRDRFATGTYRPEVCLDVLEAVGPEPLSLSGAEGLSSDVMSH